MCVCVCVCVYESVCIGYICLLLCVEVEVVFNMCVYEDTCATQHIELYTILTFFVFFDFFDFF